MLLLFGFIVFFIKLNIHRIGKSEIFVYMIQFAKRITIKLASGYFWFLKLKVTLNTLKEKEKKKLSLK